MKILKLLFKRETLMPMAAMSFATLVSVAIILARVFVTGNIRYTFLVWNLFLAWLPLVFAVLARDNFREGKKQSLRFFGYSAAWLLFFPNAPYIFTDLIHLTNRYFHHFWVDLAVILSCAFTGLVLGFVSLYLMQSLVTRKHGTIVGWLFVAATMGLTSIGIYLGRFLRFNSWDVIANPGEIVQGISSVATGQIGYRGQFTFLAFFATFLFIAYLMLYALTHLPRAAELHSALKTESPAPSPA